MMLQRNGQKKQNEKNRGSRREEASPSTKNLVIPSLNHQTTEKKTGSDHCSLGLSFV